MSELGKQLGLLAIIIIVIALVLTLFSAWPSQSPAPAGPPALTASEAQELQQMPQFQYLVSYTNSGFEPDTLTIKQGQTVRFTDNSSEQLWVASISDAQTQSYPGTSSCGGSSFDSCQTLNPGDFWQFTFTEPGTWEFQNNGDTAHRGTMTVTVQ